jgi:hypothetical protein
MSLDEVFAELINQKEDTIKIHPDGTYTYLYNSPTLKTQLEQADKLQYSHPKDGVLYVIPKNGDLLLNVEVQGEFEEATLFQYDWTGLQQIVYATLDGPGKMNPFPSSGIPLIQVGKAIYLEVKNASADVIVYGTYAILETKSLKAFATYSHGLKAVHETGSVYQAFYALSDYGHSVNCFQPICNKNG